MAVAINTQDIDMFLQGHADKTKDITENVDALLESIMEAAVVLERSNENGKVDTCKNAFKELLVLQAQTKTSADAFRRVAESYEAPPSGSTDFRALLADAEAVAPVQCEPEQQEEYQDLEERLWNVHHAGQPMPGRDEAFGEDEDLIMENSRGDISKNPKCPISGVEMLSLKDPVVDEMGFVYEKEAILQWLANQPGAGRYPVRAPIAAVGHSITKAGLKRAVKVIRAQKQKQRMPQTQAAAQEDILDV